MLKYYVCRCQVQTFVCASMLKDYVKTLYYDLVCKIVCFPRDDSYCQKSRNGLCLDLR
jgi:hypothetical protein